MSVGQKDVFDLQIVLVNKTDYAVGISAGIDNRCLAGVSVENNITIGGVPANRDGLYLHCPISSSLCLYLFGLTA